ncbi:MAG TPA: membrane lipoprotein lipid attachment site-containing protein [Bacteroidales bacterium]|nr:membrane lipoprotein lipid attachment site-containing protein [Bacteroidales bacterium]HPS17862.1 membrane lipoprotein lipid attachment site-containing protein [Bacteroidales bacterium]
MKKIIFILFSIFLLASCEDHNFPWTKKYKVLYKASGTSKKFSISYYNVDGLKCDTVSSVEWTYNFKARQHSYLALHIKNLDTLTANSYVEGRITVSNNQEYYDKNTLIVDLSGSIE